MKRINLVKYGFVRWPEEDFNDDGSNFICYRAGKAVRVSKLVSDGQVYLSIDSSCGKGTLPYEIYSKLPYYKEANWTYNGVSVETLTEADIQAFYEACISYEKAYEETEATIKYPTLEEITEQCEKLWAKAMAEYSAGQTIVMDAVLLNKFIKLSDYEVKSVRDALRILKEETERFHPKTYPQRIVGQAESFKFVSPDNSSLTRENYWLKDLREIFVKK
jgi:hypothetical protein